MQHRKGHFNLCREHLSSRIFSWDTLTSFKECEAMFKDICSKQEVCIEWGPPALSHVKTSIVSRQSPLNWSIILSLCSVHTGNSSKQQGLSLEQTQRYLDCGCEVLKALIAGENEMIIMKTHQLCLECLLSMNSGNTSIITIQLWYTPHYYHHTVVKNGASRFTDSCYPEFRSLIMFAFSLNFLHFRIKIYFLQ